MCVDIADHFGSLQNIRVSVRMGTKVTKVTKIIKIAISVRRSDSRECKVNFIKYNHMRRQIFRSKVCEFLSMESVIEPAIECKFCALIPVQQLNKLRQT